VGAEVQARIAPQTWIMSFRLQPNFVTTAVLAVVLAALTIVPLIVVVVGSLRPSGLLLTPGFTLAHYYEVWGSLRTYVILLDTAIFSIASTALAISIALVLAWLLERTDLSGRHFFKAAILMPMATPSLLLAMGWILILSPRIGVISLVLQQLFGWSPSWLNIYSMPGMIFVQALSYVPTAVLLFAPVMKNMDPSLEEAARVSQANVWQVLTRVSLPFLFPAILSVATLLLIIGMLTFDVPAVIGIPANITVMSSEVYDLMHPASGLPEYGKSAALNCFLIVVLLFALWFYLNAIRHTERFATITGKGYKSAPISLGKWRPVAMGALLTYYMLAVVLPFTALVWASIVPYFSGFDQTLLSKLSLNAYIDIFTNDRVRQSIMNSLIVAVAAAVAVTVLALALSWLVVRSKTRFVGLLDVLAMIPISIPHMMIGVALIFVFLTFRGIPIYGTVWIIAIGHVIAFLPFAARLMQAGMLQINKELEEAASVAGASVWESLRRVVVPLLTPAIAGLLIWVIVHSLREFSVGIMLKSGRNEVLSTILYSFWSMGNSERAAAIAVVFMIALGALVLVTRPLWRSHSGDSR
jgi:iron(III) transport system permease protein